MTSPLDTVPAPAFDPNAIQAALVHAVYLEMAVSLSDDFDTADEVLLVAPFHFKPRTPFALWSGGIGGDVV